jgi:hypothetical protein
MKTAFKIGASIALLSFGICCPLCSPVFAQEEPSAPAAPAAAEIPASVTVEQPAAAEMLSDDDLQILRGGQAIVLSNQTLTAIANGNVLNGNYIAGQISLTDNALSNFNGMGNFVINTGAQNNLQSAMNVTINFAQ